MMRYSYCLFAIFLNFIWVTVPLKATDFILAPHVFPSVMNGAAAWGDYDNDGDFDLAICGDQSKVAGSVDLIFQIFNNNGSNGFALVSSLTGLFEGEIKWADLDNDGFVDLIACGATAFDPAWSEYTPAVLVYRNAGNGTFTLMGDVGIDALALSSIDVADINRDGFIDVVAAGSDSNGLDHCNVYLNAGAFKFNKALSMQGLHHARLKLGDFNRDAMVDLAISGFNDSSNPVTRIYTGSEQILMILANGTMAGVSYGDLVLTDLNDDGYDDVVLSGSKNGVLSKVYQNLKDLTVLERVSPAIPGLLHSSVDAGDFDNDGDMDIFLMGSSPAFTSMLAINQGDFGFTSDPFPFAGMVHPVFASADINLDGRMDILACGAVSPDLTSKETRLYLGNSAVVNSPPSVPVNLQQEINGDLVTLSWDASSDSQNNTNTLTYNIYMGTSSMKDDRLSVDADLESGRLMTLRQGNNGHANQLSLNLNPGTYYWGVQAIDNSFLPSDFSIEKVLVVTPPSTVNRKDRVNFDIEYLPETKELKCLLPETVGGDCSLIIFDVYGRRVFEFKDLENPVRLDLSKIKSGVYVASCYLNGVRHDKKFLVY